MQDTEIYTLRSFSLKKANWSLLCSWLMLYALKKKVVCSVEQGQHKFMATVCPVPAVQAGSLAHVLFFLCFPAVLSLWSGVL